MSTTPATAVFFEEAQEQCAVLEALLLELEKNPDDEALGARIEVAGRERRHPQNGASEQIGARAAARRAREAGQQHAHRA